MVFDPHDPDVPRLPLPGTAKYTALAERLRQLRNRIIQDAQDALDFLAEALKVARTVVDAARNPIRPSSWTKTTSAYCPGSSATTRRRASR